MVQPEFLNVFGYSVDKDVVLYTLGAISALGSALLGALVQYLLSARLERIKIRNAEAAQNRANLLHPTSGGIQEAGHLKQVLRDAELKGPNSPSWRTLADMLESITTSISLRAAVEEPQQIPGRSAEPFEKADEPAGAPEPCEEELKGFPQKPVEPLQKQDRLADEPAVTAPTGELDRQLCEETWRHLAKQLDDSRKKLGLLDGLSEEDTALWKPGEFEALRRGFSERIEREQSALALAARLAVEWGSGAHSDCEELARLSKQLGERRQNLCWDMEQRRMLDLLSWGDQDAARSLLEA